MKINLAHLSGAAVISAVLAGSAVAENFDDLVINQVRNDVRILIANTRVTVEDDLIENFSATDFIFLGGAGPALATTP